MAERSSEQNTRAFKAVRGSVLIILPVLLLLTGIFAWPTLSKRFQPASRTPTSLSQARPISTEFATPEPPTRTPTATNIAPPVSPPTFQPFLPINPLGKGLVVFSMQENGYFHLFLFQGQGSPFLRLTSGEWSDINPALSPDGKQLAFASNRDGVWDIYILDLSSGDISRLTNTAQFDASPSWSPDGMWLAHESYEGNELAGNMEIYIHSVDGSQPPILLTQHPAADHSPAWSPQGRKIAFISSRSGEEDVWLADLDQVENRFQNISRNRDTLEAHPSWSRDGRYLTWASALPDGLQQIQMWDMEHPDDRARPVNSGDWSVWGPDGDAIIASLRTPNQDYLTSYDLRDTRLAMPIIALSGAVAGLSWGDINLQEIPSSLFQPDAGVTLTPAWSPVLSSGEILPGNRYQIVPLEGVEAPFPMLHDRADESFNALRSRVSRDAGWDFLATLEQAYLPLTSPLAQGMVEDWLYTGRAFRFHTAPISADWVAVIREDFGSQTYWRVFVRTRFQDGTQGMPMTSQPWDFLARHSGDPWAYEQGGMREEIPAGYWLDFTRLAAAYGWGRQPALSTWRSAYSAARFNEYILAEGLDWFSAMLEIYPREALNTTTPVYSPTPSFTPTRTPTASRTLTRTPFPTRTPTLSPTPRPTRTPRPTNTPWPTVTPKSSNTPRWSPTPTPMPSLPV